MRVLLLFIALFGTLPGLSTASAQVPSEGDFATKAFLSSPELAPDGNLVAAVHHRDEGDMLLIINGDGGVEQTIDLTPYQVSDLNWAGNERLLVSVIADGRFYREEIKVSRLIIYDLERQSFMVADERARGILAGEVLWADPEGASALVASQRSAFDTPMVRRIDLATGEAETEEKSRSDVWNWIVDSRGVVRMGIAVDGRRYKIYYRQREGEKFDTIRGKFDRDDDDEDGVVETFYFGSDSNRTLAMTNGPTGRFALYRYDLDSETVGEQVFAHETADLDGVVRNGNGDVIGVFWHDTRRRVHWIDEKMRAIQADLDTAMPGKVNTIRSFSRDHNRLLVFSGAANDPGSYILVDLAARSATRLFEPYEKVPAASLSPVEPVHFASRDGLTIPAFLTLPKGRVPEKLPLILLPHGGPFARDTWDYDPLVQYFASRGYAVFQPQFRGSTGYGRDFIEAGEGQWGRAMQDDLNDGLDWLAAQGTIDPKRVCIVGISYGGYAAMWGAIRDSERYRCAASFGGVSDLPAMLKQDKGHFSAKRYYRDWRDKVAGGLKRRDLDIFSPVDHAERLSVPLFLAHGVDDDIVPVSHTHDMVEALEDAGHEPEVMIYEETGHNIYYRDHFEDWLFRLGAFVAHHNPSTAAAR